MTAPLTLAQATRNLIIDANRLCDRQLGGTYEEDCRRSIEAARAALLAAVPQEPQAPDMLEPLTHWGLMGGATVEQAVQWMLKRLEHHRDKQAASAPPQGTEKRCSGCGHRWSVPEGFILNGAELCGDCWRKAQPVLHGAAPPQGWQSISDEDVKDRARALWADLCEGEGEHSERLDVAVITSHLHRFAATIQPLPAPPVSDREETDQ